MKKLTIFGSTGSVGRQALEVVSQIGGVKIIALSVNSNVELLIKQIERFTPEAVCVVDEKAYDEAKRRIDTKSVKLFGGKEGLLEPDMLKGSDMALNALVGSAGLLPTLNAIDKGVDIALANKETLVCAGSLVMEKAREKNVKIIPVDSEHSAIFQCLQGSSMKDIEKIHITASGGPFRKTPPGELKTIKSADALKHPNWNMGKKITIDSATLMNKGLEMIEAKWLFNIDMENINVVVHPQSIIHSMVEFKDGSILAQLGAADMRLPIAYAITYPKRVELGFKKLDFFGLNGLDFEKPRYDDFPCLNLAKRAMAIGGAMPACMNAANEAAVSRFLKDEINFTQIPVIIEKTMSAYTYKEKYALSDILEADEFGRKFACEVI